MSAVTDAGPTEMGQAMSEPVRNLFAILDVVSEKQVVDHFREKHASCEIRYGDLKKQLAEDIIIALTPIREKLNEILADNEYLARVVREGGEKARESAGRTVREVREIIGYKPF